MPPSCRWMGLVAMLAGLALPAVAGAASKPTLRRVAAVGVAATGQPAALTVTVANRGHGRSRKAHLSLQVQAVGATTARPLKASHTAVPALRKGKSKRLRLTTAALPADLAPGASFVLKVCLPKAACRTTKPVLVTEASIGALTQAAIDRKIISPGTAAVDLARTAAGDPGLRAPFRFAAPSGVDDHAAGLEASALYSQLPKADQARMAPYFVPRAARKYVRAVVKQRSSRAAHSAANSCSYLSSSSGRTEVLHFAINREYNGISAAGDQAVVWYQKDRPGDKASAQLYADALGEAWPKLTKQFKVPVSDGDRQCLNAGDGRYDVYVEPSLTDRAVVLPMWIFNGVTSKDVAENWTNPGCSRVPTYMSIRPDLKRWVIAHELMHAIQSAYAYKECQGYENAWFDEGSANWAGDFVFGKDDDEHEWRGAFTDHIRPIWALNSDYGTWPFWYFLTQTKGVSVMNAILDSLGTRLSRQAVDSAIGGFAQQWPLYQRWLINSEPVGAKGFPVSQSFLGLDRLDGHATFISDTALTLTGAPAGMYTAQLIAGKDADYCVPSATPTLYRFHDDHCVYKSIGPEASVFQHFTLPDKGVRFLKFTNGLKGQTGEHVEAWFKLADGNWKTADWSGDETKLCRDETDQDAQDLFVVTTNVASTGDGFKADDKPHQIEVRNTCPFPKRYDGTFKRVYTAPDLGATFKETITASATFVHSPVFPDETDALSSVPYPLDHGTVSWKVEGTRDGACPLTYSGSGSEALSDDDTNHGAYAKLTLEKVTGHQGAPDPEPHPYYYSIRAGGHNDGTAPEYDITDCNHNVTHSPIILPWIDVGEPSPVGLTDPAYVQKSDTAKLLAGQRSGPDRTGPGISDEDSWSFTGSD